MALMTLALVELEVAVAVLLNWVGFVVLATRLCVFSLVMVRWKGAFYWRQNQFTKTRE